MGSISVTTPTAKGAVTPGGSLDKLQNLAIRRANRKAAPSRLTNKLAELDPRTYLTQPTLLESYTKKAADKKKKEAEKKKKEAAKKKKKTTKKKKKKKGKPSNKLIRKIKKYGIKN